MVAERDWLGHLADDPASRSKTSVCLQFADRSDVEANKARQKALAKLLEAEGAAYDIAGYRDAPPGLRIWCGATVDTADIEALGPWLDWAWERSHPRAVSGEVNSRDSASGERGSVPLTWPPRPSPPSAAPALSPKGMIGK